MCALLFVYRFFNVWKTTIEDIVGKMKCETIERNVSIHKYDANKTNISSMQFGWNSSIRAQYIYLTFLPYFQIPLSICNVLGKMRQEWYTCNSKCHGEGILFVFHLKLRMRTTSKDFQ